MIFRKSNLLGLDIGSSYLKVVQLKDARAGYELALFDLLPLQPGIISDGLITDKDRLVSSIKELLQKAGVKRGDAVLGLSGHSSVIIKRISLPVMTEEELSVSMKYEAEQYIPFDVNDVSMDFQILGPKQGEEGRMDVVLVAVKKNVIEDCVEVVSRAGLTPVVVDVDSFALSNMYEMNYDLGEKRNVALINVGASTTNINILQGGTPVFTRDSAIGSNYHTEALERTLGVSREDAERLKRGYAIEGIAVDDAHMVIDTASQEIFAEVYRSFEYFRSSVSDEDIHQIVLSGGAALIGGFSELMAERIGIPAEIADPFRKVTMSKKLDGELMKDMAPIAAVAVGLAMRRARDSS